jgi:hypothetical protein
MEGKFYLPLSKGAETVRVRSASNRDRIHNRERIQSTFHDNVVCNLNNKAIIL